MFRSTSITAQYEAVRAGAGLAVLPAESKHLARMQAVWAFLKETVVGEAKQLMSDGAGNVSRL